MPKFKKKEEYENTNPVPGMPGKIKIDTIVFDVIPKYPVINGNTGRELVAGQISYQEGIIEISTNRSIDNLKQTLLHEVVHGILKTRGVENLIPEDVRENVVEGFATGLLQVIRDNPRLMDYLEKHDL